MLCSHCGDKVLPVVVFDLDGTLAEYHKAFTSFCGRYFDRDMRSDWDGSGNFEDYLGLTRPEYREAKLAYRQGGNKRWLAHYEDPWTLFKTIQEQFTCEIWIATTRPWQRLDNIDPDTTEWIRRRHLNVHGLLYGEDKYERLVGVVDPRRIVACVEDLISQFLMAERLKLPVFQVERPHNRAPGLRGFPRGNMAAAMYWILAGLERWTKENNNGD